MIYITGVGRCGTSLLAQIFQEGGYNLGSAPLDKYYEDPRIAKFNDKLIRALGGSSFFIPPNKNELAWDRIPENLFRESENLISDNRSVMKDPRFAIVYPFWEKISSSSKEIIAIRNPDAIVKSFNVRDRISYQTAYDLFIRYTNDSLSNFYHPIIIDYDTWFESPEINLSKLKLTELHLSKILDKRKNHFEQATKEMTFCKQRQHAWDLYERLVK